MNSSTNNSNSSVPLANPSLDYQNTKLNIYYTVCEVLVAVVAVFGNALVIFVFQKERRLRRRTNYYIVSLATADLLVGLLGIPFAIMSSIGLPYNLYACLFTISLLVVLCTISIFCLVAVSVDRYWAILHPMGYSRNVSTKTALVIISICWMAGSIVGFLPLMGWYKDTPMHGGCFFLNVMDYNYLLFLYFGTIITPAIVLAAFYTHIYRVVLKQLRQIVTMNPENGSSSSGTMLRMLGAAQKREVKATQNLAIIVLFFMICWFPLYTINCILAFCPNCYFDSTFMLSSIILSHLNSAGNPLLYAYHLKDFRAALRNFFLNIFGITGNLTHTKSVFDQNSHKYRVQLRNLRLDQKNKYISTIKRIEEPKISTIVKNSATLAVATAVEDKSIWKINESSSESSESCDKTTIIRPGTPYRPRTDLDNKAYMETSSNESVDKALINKHHCNVKIVSSSSPQLDRGLFYIEKEGDLSSAAKKARSSSVTESRQNDSALRKLSPFKVVSGIFKMNKGLKRSLSNDTASFKKPNGTVNC